MLRKLVFYGNCQAEALYRVMIKFFPTTYDYKLYMNFIMIQEESPIPLDFYDCDVFIFQPLKDKGDLSTDHILKNVLKPGCTTLSFAYLYFLGLFPDYIKDPLNEYTVSDLHPYGKFPYAYDTIRMRIVDGKDPFPLPQLTEDFIKCRLKESLDMLEVNEKITDIKTVNFIKKNYQRIQLFSTVNHPTNFLLEYVMNCILDKLNLHRVSLKKTREYITSCTESLIYPCVFKTLQLKFKQDTVKTINEYLKPEEHLRMYVKTIYPKTYASSKIIF